MKKAVFFILINTMAFQAFAQMAGIGTITPHASALLDLGTTGKGLLIPRMTSQQRNAIPQNTWGFMVYDTDTKSTWSFQGAVWNNLNNYGLNMPFYQTVNANVDAFSLTNAGTGAAIKGVSTRDNQAGVSGQGQSSYGYGIYGTATGANAIGVYGNTTDATAIKARATNGLAVEATSSANNAIKAGILVGANPNPALIASHAGAGAAVDGTSASGYGIKGTTSTSSTSGAAVFGFNSGTQGNGVFGAANFATGYGVQGSSTTGTGVYGYTNAYRGVAGITISGSGLYGNSSSGYGLETIGNIKISGGNTNPAADRVLSSDASGNASWQPMPKVAFRAVGIDGSGSQYIPDKTYTKLNFSYVDYNIPTSFSTNSDEFTVPANGVYHFDFTTQFDGDQIFDTKWVTVYLKLNRGGTISTLTATPGERGHGYSNGLGGEVDVANFFLSGSFRLLTGDKLWLEIYHDTGYECEIESFSEQTYFSGHWVSN